MDIHLIKNDKGNGDWCVIAKGEEVIYEGHSVGFCHLKDILEQCKGFDRIVEHHLTDEEIEDWQSAISTATPEDEPSPVKEETVRLPVFDLDITPWKEPKCKHCGREKGRHQAKTMNCPLGKGRLGNFPSFHKTQTFEAKPTRGTGKKDPRRLQALMATSFRHLGVDLGENWKGLDI